MRLLFTILIFFIITGCQTDGRENPRAYIEGKITESSLQFSDLFITIKSENAIVAEVVPDDSGDFTLSGPLVSTSFSLVFNSKIKSFKTSVSGATISADSLKILIPEGKTYVIFNDIKLK